MGRILLEEPGANSVQKALLSRAESREILSYSFSYSFSLVNSLKKERSVWEKNSGGNGIWNALYWFAPFPSFASTGRKQVCQGRRQQCETCALHSQPAAPGPGGATCVQYCVLFLSENPALPCPACFDMAHQHLQCHSFEFFVFPRGLKVPP